MDVKKSKDKKIAALCCENSSYKAASSVDGDGVLDDVRLIPLPCSGKAEIDLVLRLLETGYEGVLVLGCPKDNCMFMRGSTRAEKRIETVKRTLEDIGMDAGRVRMDFMSSLDTHKFVRAVRDLREYLSAGPAAGGHAEKVSAAPAQKAQEEKK